MKRFVTAMSLTFCMAWSLPEAHAQQQQPMSCEVGPVHRTFGGTPWLVYSCADGKSLAVVADTAHGASPFFFVVAWNDTGYRVSGEGNGDGSAFNAAGRDLEALTPAQISALLGETRAVKNPTSGSAPL